MLLDLRAAMRGDDEEATVVRPVHRPHRARGPRATLDTMPDFVSPWALPVWPTSSFDASVPLVIAEPPKAPNVFLAPPGPGDGPSPFASVAPAPPAARARERKISPLLVLSLVTVLGAVGLLVWDDPVLRADVRARAEAAYAAVR
jgi:hypothetical protein